MSIKLGTRYTQYANEHGCLCHSDIMSKLNERINKGLSRRSVLRGILGGLAVTATGGILPAFAQVEKQQPLLLTNIRIFDGRSPKLLENKSLLISGNQIIDIMNWGDRVDDALILDGGNRVLMPGLIDAHWHSIMARLFIILCKLPLLLQVIFQTMIKMYRKPIHG